MKYEFHVGDYVETKDGRVGYITEINYTYIPYIEYELSIGERCYQEIGSRDADVWESRLREIFNRIGQYDFSKSEQSKEIERLPDDLLARFELPDGKSMILKTYTDSKDFVEASYSRELINKINELVDAVNELREAKDDKSIS